MAYAEDTKIPVEKSRAEIERMLRKAGAVKFAFMNDELLAVIGFELQGRVIRFNLPLPNLKDKAFNWSGHAVPRRLSQREGLAKHEQACRSKWRSLMLCIKAKLEAIECGITTFDQEFLAHIVIQGGQTIGEYTIPRLNDAVGKGLMPTLSLEFGGPR